MAGRRGSQLVHGFGRQACAARDDVAGLDKGNVVAVLIGHLGMAQTDEFVDIELVVGEQYKILEPLGRRACVVAQAVQRVVDARSGKQR